MKSIAVYCGSKRGNNLKYAEKATELGQTMAAQGISLVYGGGRVGLMGVIADAVIAAGGKVTGVMPHFLGMREIHHPNVADMIMVDTMAVRKTKMIDMAEGFIAMPGGYGTLEEISEVLTMGILGPLQNLPTKPVGLLNVDGFFNPLLTFFDAMVTAGFLQQPYRNNALVADNPTELIEKMRAWTPPQYSKFDGDIFKN
jgi:hypothetical protein